MSAVTPLDIFRKACGLDTTLDLVCQEPESPTARDATLDGSRPFLLIGRLPSADLVLQHPHVSRRHCYLQAVAGGVYGIDLETRRKTFWDDQQESQDGGWLEPGHSIRIGPYRIARRHRPVENPALDARPDPFAPLAAAAEGGPDPLPRPSLELPFRVGGISSAWEMAGLLALVGRSDRCQLMLTDNSVSLHHACLVRTPLGAWIVDLAGREGVHVNGTRVRWAWLADGDLVRIGLFTMVLRYDRPLEGIGRDDVPLDAGASPIEGPDDDQRVMPGSGDGERNGLALRPRPGPAGLMRATVAPRGSNAAVPAAIDRGEWEPVPAMGPGQNAIWQQQMQLMETFHNDMAMMVKMFVAMHREFQATVRGELDRVQDLTQELSRLNARLGTLPDSGGTAPAVKTPAPQRKAQPVPAAKPAKAEAGERPRVARRDAKPAEQPPRERAATPTASGRPAPAGDRGGKPMGEPTPQPTTTELYAELTRRITEIQRERRSYWERILKVIGG